MPKKMHLAILATAVIATLASPAASASEGTRSPELRPDDFSAPIVDNPDRLDAASTTQGVLDDDPLGLVPKLPFVQRYSLDTDHWEVWLCGNTGYTLTQAVNELDTAMGDYFSAVSGGRYTIAFSPGGILPGDSACLNGFRDGTYSPAGSPEGLFIIDSVTSGGFASPGVVCSGDSNCEWIGTTYPENRRYAVVGAGVLKDFPSVAVHEIGHTLQWPHSNSGQSEYDNPIDLMSGNSTVGGWTEARPYSTLAFNRYQSGWTKASDVIVASNVYQEVVLEPFTATGTQMIAVLTNKPGVFFAFGTRVSSTYDPIPIQWEGVEVYKIDHDCPGFTGPCPGIWRDQTQQPPNPEGVAHVLQPGEAITLEGITIKVLARTGSGFTVGVGYPSNSLPFVDIAGSSFVNDIVWLAGESITKGCNPPANTRYCPTASITRGEMAAFLVRDLGLTDAGTAGFADTAGSPFEADVAKLATAGITKGCNPPANTNFCPNAIVTRDQMAAFLSRAYGLADNGGGNTFTDDDGSVFEDDIARLAAAGITRSCNPPSNTHFCPRSAVTREQMAAFLYRAATG